jgi:hypothetical protein
MGARHLRLPSPRTFDTYSPAATVPQNQET